MIVSVSVGLAFFNTLVVAEGDGRKAVGLSELLDIMQEHAELTACAERLQFSRYVGIAAGSVLTVVV